MNLVEYYGGKRVTLVSRLSAEEAADRIDDAAVSTLMPFGRGIIGWAKLGFIRLTYRPGYFRSDLRPVLAGAIRDSGSGSRINLRYRAPIAMYVAPFIWAGFIFVFLKVLVPIQKVLGTEAVSFQIIAILLVITIPAVQLVLALRNADADMERLVTFVAEKADATVQSRG